MDDLEAAHARNYSQSPLTTPDDSRIQAALALEWIQRRHFGIGKPGQFSTGINNADDSVLTPLDLVTRR
jgi:hypothetical protein